jgi:hypothetical protein
MYKYKYKYKYGMDSGIDRGTSSFYNQDYFTAQQTTGGAFFYDKENGEGDSFVIYAPTPGWPNLGNWNDRIQSVRVLPNTKVTLWENPDFGGRSLNLESPGVHNLRDYTLRHDRRTGRVISWYKVPSSIQVFRV